MATIEELREIAFFSGFSDEELVRVCDLVTDVDAEAGAVLTDQGRPGLVCYIIRDGRANVFYQQEHVATLNKGTMVGEMALVDHRPRTATVVAETPMRLYGLELKSFRMLLDEMPTARERVNAMLEARLKAPAPAGE